jgi:hypothetical protein
MGEAQAPLFNSVMTNPLDQTAYNLLQTAVVTGVQYFPKHTQGT